MGGIGGASVGGTVGASVGGTVGASVGLTGVSMGSTGASSCSRSLILCKSRGRPISPPPSRKCFFYHLILEAT